MAYLESSTERKIEEFLDALQCVSAASPLCRGEPTGTEAWASCGRCLQHMATVALTFCSVPSELHRLAFYLVEIRFKGKMKEVQIHSAAPVKHLKFIKLFGQNS